MNAVQCCTRLSQDVVEQDGDFQHLRGEEGFDPPHLPLKPAWCGTRDWMRGPPELHSNRNHPDSNKIKMTSNIITRQNEDPAISRN